VALTNVAFLFELTFGLVKGDESICPFYGGCEDEMIDYTYSPQHSSQYMPGLTQASSSTLFLPRSSGALYLALDPQVMYAS
jgi:hypothetical protein